MVQLSGSLSSADLPSVIKLLSELGQTGTLELTRDGWTARIGLRAGSVVAAAFGEERGLGAIMSLSRVLHDARFRFIEGNRPANDDLDLTPRELADHLEATTHRHSLSFDAVPLRTNGNAAADGGADRVVLSRRALSNLLSVDGQRTVRDLIGDGPIAETLRNLADLIEFGLITMDGERKNGSLANAHRPSAPAQSLSTAGSRLDLRQQEVGPPAAAPSTVSGGQSRPPAHACPKLGFADDPVSHFARPTALHRCFATGSISPVSTIEQRDLCLSGGFAMCPRLRAALGDGADLAALAPAPGRTVERGQLMGAANPALQAMELPAALPGKVDWPPVAGLDLESVARPLDRAPAAPGSTLDAQLSQPSAPVARRELPLLPVIAIGLAVAAVLTWSYVLLRPRPQTSTVPQPATTLANNFVGVTASPALAPTTATSTARTSEAPTAAATTPAITSTAAPTMVPTPVAVAPTAQVATQEAALLDTASSVLFDGWRSNPPFASNSGTSYTLMSSIPGRFVAISAPMQDAVADVAVNATFRKVAGPPGGGYGLILRDQEPALRDGSNQGGQYYVFEIADNGRVGVWRRDNDRWMELQSWTPSTAVQTGTTSNDLAVRVVGNQLSFTVNGVDVFNASDDSLGPGGVGVFVGGDSNEVALEKFVVRRLN
jgi:hypothetical protein